MKKLNEMMYVQEEGTLLIHMYGPHELAPWCVVDTGSGPLAQSKLLAMFAELDDALAFCETKIGEQTSVPGREWSVVG